ncbi:prepilin-type N-terminal cleavage/methylation domain-containing protein [Desulfopila sp. IMCC35008]|uniref:prepilin-type N-terminal cleavage/methylation domain-containing protein n=1 Tax=Desulfopila sp. IMCC35008 TaxID=2653858 RepID=UPI0013D359A7|nr:prepilin-type N-terminal cleavage/methylation domain-containing protein [Desulfopila sp. IMCC35008]
MIISNRQNNTILTTRNGFTLVELMVGLAITSVIITAVFAAYTTQQRLYVSQDQIAEMQQNLRAAVDYMAREIRMAGYDPTGESGAGLLATSDDDLSLDQMSFTLDANEDEDTADDGEHFRFHFSTGLATDFAVEVRDGGALTSQVIAENIQAVEFLYLDKDGDPTLVPENARSVKVSMLARAGDQDRKFQHTSTYTTPSGATWGPYNDRYRRRFVMANIQLRNVGI